MQRDNFVDDEDIPATDQGEAAPSAGGARIGGRQIEHDERELCPEAFPNDQGAGGVGLAAIVDDERIVADRAGSVVARSHLGQEVVLQVVIVRSQIDRPAMAAGIEDEAAEIVMRMPRVRVVRAGLDPEIGRIVGVSPVAAQHKDFGAAKPLGDRQTRPVVRVFIEPQQVHRMRRLTRALLLDKCIDRVVVAFAEP